MIWRESHVVDYAPSVAVGLFCPSVCLPSSVGVISGLASDVRATIRVFNRHSKCIRCGHQSSWDGNIAERVGVAMVVLHTVTWARVRCRESESDEVGYASLLAGRS